MSLPSPVPGQFCWDSGLSQCSGYFTKSTSQARMRLICTNIWQKATFLKLLCDTSSRCDMRGNREKASRYKVRA